MLRQKARIKCGNMNILALDIIDLIVSETSILVKRKPEYLILADDNDPFILKIKVYSKSDFLKLRFDYISFIKKDPRPDNRVADFEWIGSDGLRDFDKLEALIEGRKSRKEKKDELDLEIFIYQETIKMGLEYYGPLKGMI